MNEKQEVKLETVDTNYLEEIENLKTKMESMVNGDEYNKVLQEHKRLTSEYVNKRPVPQPSNQIHREPVTILSELNKDISNHDYIKKTLEYRNSVLKSTGKDVFTDVGINGPGTSTPDSIEVAEAFEAMLELAETPADFNYVLDKTLKDEPQLTQMLRAKNSKDRRN